MAEQTIRLEQMEQAMDLFGSVDSNMRLIEQHCGVSIINRGDEMKITGDAAAVAKAARAAEGLLQLIRRGEQPDARNVRYVLSLVDEDADDALPQLAAGNLCVTAKGKPIKAKTLGQKRYTDAIAANTVVLGIGPAGTGKTYLAVALAVAAFRNKTVSRIILTRPAVEAGEKLGFLPGDLQAKIDPYLRPLYDALFDMLGSEAYQKYIERGDIEIAPLAYMRGRTLDDSFIILDEAQNTTPEQMKMFLTRLGFRSRMVVTGDITQIDLPDGKRSGLKEAMRVLDGVEDVAICRFTEKDVVRHELVQRIIAAYEKYDNKPRKQAERPHAGNGGKKASGKSKGTHRE